MFPISTVVSGGSGGGVSGLTESQVRSIVTGYNYITASQVPSASAGMPFIYASPHPTEVGFYDAPVYKNRIIIVNPLNQHAGNTAAFVNIDSRYDDDDEFEFVVVNTGAVNLNVRNTKIGGITDNTEVAWVDGATGAYAYGALSRTNIAPKHALRVIRINKNHSWGITQPSGPFNIPNLPTAGLIEYPL